MATALLDYGRRVQESVFVASLDSELAGRMQERVVKLINHDEDSLCIFAICEGCEKRTKTFGVAAVPVDKPYYIV